MNGKDRARILARLKKQHEEDILHAENLGGPSATVGVELAICEPKQERAILAYAQTPRSGR